MNTYERIYNILIENQVPEGDPPLPGMSSKDLAHYKGRPSREKVKKKTVSRAKKKEADANTRAMRSGSATQQRGK